MTHRQLGLVSITGGLFALIIVLMPESQFATPSLMDAYFGGETSPGSWTWSGSWSWTQEPFRYRLVFHGLVDALAHVAEGLGAPRDLTTYWGALLSVTILSVVLAFLALFKFLMDAYSNSRIAWIGLALFILLPSIHLAFVAPVQTKEDFLAYAVLFAGLSAVLKNDYRTVLILSCFGAFVRETLLILPLLYALSTDKSWQAKIAIVAIPAALLVALRILLGVDGYDVTREENFADAAAFLTAIFFLFGFAWIGLFLSLRQASASTLIKRAYRSFFASGPRSGTPLPLASLNDSILLVLPLMLIAHIFMGRIFEIRISTMIAIFAILALASKLSALGLMRFAKTAIWPVFALTVIVVLEASGVIGIFRNHVNAGLGPFASQIWWAAFYIQVALTVWCLALLKR